MTLGAWLKADQLALQDRYHDIQSKYCDENETTQRFPVIRAFQELIEQDAELSMLFRRMFEQIPCDPRFMTDPAGNPSVRNYRDLLRLMNALLTQAPEFNQTPLVGCPLNAIVNWAMGTAAGSRAFMDRRVNNHLKQILNQWALFLTSPASRAVLNDHPDKGWFGQKAQEVMPSFDEDFVSNACLPCHGFSSWDDFFTRRFRDGRRPVASPGDHRVIVNACESAPYRLAHQVRLLDRFWIKDQPYSLFHMLDGDPLSTHFDGGTVYQGFLSALSYHRWHSPVSGRILKTCRIDGAYYAQAPSVGYDPAAPNASQGYITQVASRALVFIAADNPALGLMALMFVGMAEVSSNELVVRAGQRVEKGDPLGMFHYGGSTYVMIFRPQAQLDFDLHDQTPGLHAENIPVNAQIAVVRT